MRYFYAILLMLMVSLGMAQPTESIIHASNGAAGDQFGTSVAISGNYAIAGSPEDEPNGAKSGSVYFYELAGGVWVEKQNISPTDGSADDEFGHSVAISGEWAIVGANLAGSSPTSPYGKVYVYHRNASGVWSLDTSFTNTSLDQFGTSVAIDGDYFVAGGINATATINGVLKQCGTAVVFRYNGSIWAIEQELFPDDGDNSNEFGHSVSISGNQIVVGSWKADPSGANAGAAYVYSRIGSQWTQDTKLVAFDGAAGDLFGNAVSIEGDKLLVSAHKDNGRKGAVYFYNKSGGTWSLANKAVAFDGATSAEFGSDCDFINPVTVIVGAHKQKNGTKTQGAVYLFEYDSNSSTWIASTLQSQIRASDGKSYDFFGGAVVGDGDYLYVGAFRDDNMGSSSGGSYFYDIAQVLPIELSSFEATVVGSEVILDWETASEVNNEGFEIQRSKDGVLWENIGWVEGFGNSTETQAYSILDKNPYQGENYYRLNQVDFDGQTEYSYIVSATIRTDESENKQVSFKVYPNPTKDYVNLEYPRSTKVKSIIVYDLSGKIMKIERSEQYRINLVDLPKGNYYLTVETQNGRFSQPILKE